jgi:transcriptional antiterminator RfaH
LHFPKRNSYGLRVGKQSYKSAFHLKLKMHSRVPQKKIREHSAGGAWYCLRSGPKQECIAAVHLRMLEGVTVFCPRIRFKRPTRQGVVWVVEPMFPAYLFARFELTEMYRHVQYARGVSGIVRFGSQYPIIREEALAQWRNHTGYSEIKELNYEVGEGDQVKIVDGVFAGLEAVVTRVMPAKQRVKVLMDFLGRKMETEVEHSSVLPGWPTRSQRKVSGGRDCNSPPDCQ